MLTRWVWREPPARLPPPHGGQQLCWSWSFALGSLARPEVCWDIPSVRLWLLHCADIPCFNSLLPAPFECSFADAAGSPQMAQGSLFESSQWRGSSPGPAAVSAVCLDLSLAFLPCWLWGGSSAGSLGEAGGPHAGLLTAVSGFRG